MKDTSIDLAPIVLFVYNRPWHTQQTVEALQKNELAKESELFIYSDEAKNEDARKSVNEVRKYIDKIDGFKKVIVIKREKNWGLADSIIDGVTKIVNEYGKIIVLEDDLVTSPYFLKFMNDALEFYKDQEKIWHINGWNNPINTKKLPDIYFSRIAYSWAWATWSDRWKNFHNNSDKYIELFSKRQIYEFNLEGTYNMWSQMIRNNKGVLKTWAVFWNAELFIFNKLALNNNLGLVKNIGTDGSGINCDLDVLYQGQNVNKNKLFYEFSLDMFHNDLAFERLKQFEKNKKKSLLARVVNKVKRYLNYE